MSITKLRQKLGLSIEQFARLVDCKDVTITYGEDSNLNKEVSNNIEHLFKINFDNDLEDKVEVIKIFSANSILELRYALGMNVSQFSKEIGVNRNSVYYYQIGSHRPSLKTAKRIIILANKYNIRHQLTVEKLISE